MALDREDPPNPDKYIINWKLIKYRGQKSSGWLMFDLGRLTWCLLEEPSVNCQMTHIIENSLQGMYIQGDFWKLIFFMLLLLSI